MDGTERHEVVKGLRDFWACALYSHKNLRMEIAQRDENALEFLQDIRSYRIDGQRGFVLEFIFGDNPYFENDLLTNWHRDNKSVTYVASKWDENQVEPSKILTQSFVKIKGPLGHESFSRPRQSFFNFFDSQNYEPFSFSDDAVSF
ncbi:hypothetical protein M0R45_004002 [Rubus argutus]|uniref:Uncharacterized protein n=1 Tax=Rubus argutus TaxID=59490 RepID=A0AAW1YHV1_RUBAR